MKQSLSNQSFIPSKQPPIAPQGHQGISRRNMVTLGIMTMLSACGGGGTIPSEGVKQRALPADFGSRKSVSYSPFRSSNRDTEIVTPANVLQDLQLLVAGGFTLIRLFDSSDKVSKLVLETITTNKLDIKVMLGVWIQKGSPDVNAAEIGRGVALAKTYSDIVLALSVGNETMVSWNTWNPVPVTEMVGYITSVRNQVTQPVTTDDNWAFFAKYSTEKNDPKPVLNAIDFVAMHSYPIADSVHNATKWNWQQTAIAADKRAVAMMDAALVALQQDYAAVRAHMRTLGLASMPIVIGETGWKAIASGGEKSRAHPVNQKMYFDRLTASLSVSGDKPRSIFYFEAFDEPWKGSDDNWGLFNVNRQARYVVQSLYPSSTWEAGTYTAADALYYIPTASNGTITANRYTIYAETISAGEVKPTEAILWTGWNTPATAYAGENPTTAAPGDGTKAMEITPAPENASPAWGWGLIAALLTTSDDLSQFVATGRLNFSIKTDYPGKIEVGFLTGTVTATTAYDVYLVIDPANNSFGYVNNNTWCNVSIPISAITPSGAKSYDTRTSALAVLDMTKVTNPFVIANRYGTTGNTPSLADSKKKFYIDNIYWSK